MIQMKPLDGAPSRMAIGRTMRAHTLRAALLSAYSELLHLSYRGHVSPAFDYLGYTYQPPQVDYYLYALVAMVLVASQLPKRIETVSAFVLWLLFLAAIVPSILMPHYTGYLSEKDALATSLGVAFVFCMVVVLVRRREPAVPLGAELPTNVFWLALIGVSLVSYLVVFSSIGVSLNAVSLSDVYDVREEYAAALGGSTLVAYLVNAQANVLNPAIIALGCLTRRWWAVGLALAGQLVLYSSTGFKTTLMVLPAILVVLLLYRYVSRPFGVILVAGIVAVICASWLLDVVRDDNVVTSLFVRRFLHTPGLLSAIYFAFFSEYDKVQLSHSILSGWIEYPYDLKLPFQISEWATGDPGRSMNANFVADGFAQFGWIGVAGAGLVLVVYLRLLDRAACGVPLPVSSAIMVLPSIALCNSSILTAMLSHGLVMAFIVLAMAKVVPQTSVSPGVKEGVVPGGQERILQADQR